MENNKNKKKIIPIIISMIILIILIMAILLIPYSRSLIITRGYKAINKGDSVLLKDSISFIVPSGKSTPRKDWFPQMIWYHDAGGFSKYMQKNLDMTVLYSFGDFNSPIGTSTYYDDASPYYGAFYGGYAIKNMDEPSEAFGFDSEGFIISEDVEKLPLYDQKYLVLPALGCPQGNRVFITEENKITEDVFYAGYDGWTLVESQIYTNGPAHKFKRFNPGYFQYGMPLKPSEGKKDFQPERFYGRMYIRYFDTYEMTFCLYVMCRDMDALEACERELLSKTVITKN